MAKGKDWLPVPEVCTHPGCGKPGHTRELCKAHYAKHRRKARRTQPRFEHDCDSCVYLGSTAIAYAETDWTKRVHYDMYYCRGGCNVIARYGPAGEYKSGVEFIHMSRSLRRAYDMAMTSDKLEDKEKFRLERYYNSVLRDRLRLLVDMTAPFPIEQIEQLMGHLDRLIDDDRAARAAQARRST